MNRIDAIFADLRGRGGKALMPFLTAGDPDVDTTGRLLEAAQRAGASVCELGIPFSDPIADGPVIQASMTHALGQGATLAAIFEMVAAVRPRLTIGLVAMVSYSIVHRLGLAGFVRDARAAGFDGFIFPDLPVQESQAAGDVVRAAGLTCTMLIAPTTPIERARRIAAACSGFVYVLARAGITGERSSLPAELPERIARLREVTELPIAVGFGVATAEHVRQVVRVADAAIVGSALMRKVAEQRARQASGLVAEVEGFIRQLAEGLPQDAAAQAACKP